MAFVGSDLWRVRQKWGGERILWVGSMVVLVNKEGKIWLGKRGDIGDWSLPGGHFELGDSAESCARNEIKEELGVEIANLKMFGVISDPEITFIRHPNGDEVQAPCFVFRAEVESEDFVLDEEHTGFEWLDLEVALERVKANERAYASTGLGMYKLWMETKEFQVR